MRWQRAFSTSLLWLVFSRTRGFTAENVGRLLQGHEVKSHMLRLSTATSVDGAKDDLSSARSVAAFALMTNSKKKYPEFSLRKLDADKEYVRLSPRDRAFARLLVATVERRKGQIEKVLSHFMEWKKSNRLSDSLTYATLTVGVAQLLFLDTAGYAAVKETVEILRMHPRIKVPDAKIKLVNAVLRRVTREGEAVLHAETTPKDNVSPWLLQEWEENWGEEQAANIVEAAMNESPTYLSVRQDPNASDEEKNEKIDYVKTQLGGDDSEILGHGSICVSANLTGAVSKWPLYNEGEWWVQDAAAAVPALALYNSLRLEDVGNMHVVDLCAAPGGKTAQLLSCGFGNVTAIEASTRRMKQLQSNLVRLNLAERCESVVADGTKWSSTKTIDGILLDVPCSATGTCSRRPDVLRKSDDMDDVLKVQKDLAEHCVDELLPVGGVLVYATCSLLRKESEEQILNLLSREDGAVLETLPFGHDEFPGFEKAIDENGWLRVIPGTLDGKLSTCDGFFVARLRRVQ